MSSKNIIAVLGPTAVGKTDKAIELAIEHQCPVISCDSRQLYTELNIGVAKPDADQLAKVKHYFISNISIHEHYTAGRYAADARQLINQLFDTFDTLVVVGGTGLYIKALLEGLDQLPERNEALRDELDNSLEKEGIETLQKRLREKSEEIYAKTEILNPQRLIRAIEIAEGRTIRNTDIPAFKYPFELKTIVMEMERERLYERINLRVDMMIEAGLEEEARGLYSMRELNALQTVGYSEWWPFFEGEYSREKAIELIKQHSRNYAKRQITWFKNQI
ncbi:MAG: tRNA (adenosine(37)-N6)-dimethylallyltransferase MiaA [Chitinophagaceae bacterium]